MPKQRTRNAVPSASRTTPRPALHSRRFAIRLAFDGTTYQGFQSQPYQNTVQDQVENRLRGLLKRDVKVMAWGRTDAGVHATGAVATVDLTVEEAETFALRNQSTTLNDEASDEGECDEGDEATTTEQRAAAFLRSVLKEFACRAGDTPMPQTRYGSISARNVVPVPSDFDARYSAKWKRYVYYVCAGGEFGEGLPFAWSRHAWHVRQNLDEELMQKAVELIDGEHNFGWMSVVQPGERRDPRRNVKLTVEKVLMQTGGDNVPYFVRRPKSVAVYKIACTCDFFLYKMVRRLVGIVVALGKRDASLDELRACLDAYDKEEDDNDGDASWTKMPIPPKLLQTAPAKGLCLEHIEYGVPI